METKTIRVDNLAGGRGHVLMTHLLGKEEMKKSARMYARVTLEPGCEIGFHKHVDESETYFVLSGTGEYNDNGTMRTISAGDVTFTPSGFSHGLLNTGNEDLVIMALILLD
ncbi:MAG: cupin domain-containing protein [Opitutae bacterium]|nr:cupin domain-containing protein [Opitutae bacterium]MCD8298469.1 cupin domain-containing protein [Opitutae bacterium]